MCLKVEQTGRIRTLTMNRPEQMNVFDEEMCIALRDALRAAEQDPGVAVVALTGAGRAFSAGADLAYFFELGARIAAEQSVFGEMLDGFAAFRKPLLAAVNGIGVGIGMTMLAYCDLVLMASDARLRTPFGQLGLAPEAGSSEMFPFVMGWNHAAYALLTGNWISAQEAKEAGLVWRVCPREQLLPETMALAEQIARQPIDSLMTTKELMLVATGRAQSARAAHQREMREYRRMIGSPVNREAIAAFLEKRKPEFTGLSGF
ncbi:MAG: enoyl-CoA hydratase-related protein [Anaerolineae bacterium]